MLSTRLRRLWCIVTLRHGRGALPVPVPHSAGLREFYCGNCGQRTFYFKGVG